MGWDSVLSLLLNLPVPLRYLVGTQCVLHAVCWPGSCPNQGVWKCRGSRGVHPSCLHPRCPGPSASFSPRADGLREGERCSQRDCRRWPGCSGFGPGSAMQL